MNILFLRDPLQITRIVISSVMVKVINDKLAILRFSDENLCNEPMHIVVSSLSIATELDKYISISVISKCQQAPPVGSW